MDEKWTPAEITLQIAHDIQSPLSALNMIVGSLSSEIPESKRQLMRAAVRRIQEIAGRALRARHSEQTQLQDLSVLLVPLILEKQILFGSRVNLEFKNNVSPSSRQASKVHPVDLLRVISNLVDNSAEAGATKIEVTLDLRDEELITVVRDNGGGIPEKIAACLGKGKVTFGKKSGRGIGIYAANKIISAAGGSMRINSSVGKNTEIELELPLNRN